MNYEPLHFSIPGVGMITTLSRRYETLTDEFIQQWLSDLYCEYLAVPDYLLVTAEGRQDLMRILASDYLMSRFLRDEQTNRYVERYPNKITGTPLTIVVFPDLPEKTLFVASMLKMAEERVQIDGAMRIVRRTYAGLKE